MKRFLAGLVSFSLILVTPPPAAWAQVADAARGVPLGGAPIGAIDVGAIKPVLALGLSSLGASSLGAPAAPSAPLFRPGLRPMEHASVAVAPVRLAAPAAAENKKASAPGLPPVAPAPAARAESAVVPEASATVAVAPGGAPAVRVGLSASALEHLFTGAAVRAGLVGDAAVSASFGAPSAHSSLAAAGAEKDGEDEGPNVPGPADAPRGRGPSKLLGALMSAGRVGLAFLTVVGLNAAAVAFAPALFAVVPVAAVWAVSSGVLLFPVGLYARYRLSKRDSPRLMKVKILLDFALGAYAGALFVAAPSLALTLSTAGVLTAVLPAAGLAAGLAARGAPFLNSVMVWGALGFTPLVLGAAAVGGIAIAPLFGMLALPAMTTIAFFLGSLITAAETGRPFAVPGSIQKMRFPSFQWVMIGVVFSLLTGYSAVHTNMAFLAWNFLGSRVPAKWDKSQPLWKNLLNKAADFDALYVGLLLFTAIGGFTSPLTFLVIAFSGERAAVWTERLLTRFLPRANPAPSTNAVSAADDAAADKPARWPKYHYWAKTFAILAAMAGIGAMMGLTVFGFHSLLISMIPAVILSALPFWFATTLIKTLMHDTPADEAHDPEFFGIMKGLREKINAKRRAQGKKEIPMPEMVNDPLTLPNAYATGRDPFHALVGVTAGIKEMTLDPENVRAGVARLMANSSPGTKAFKVFRLAIAGSITGVAEDSSPADIQAAVLKADRVELKALGVRMLTGVLGHEFSHVMDRHMLSGAIAGSVSASIAFASYGLMWAVGHAQVGAQKLIDRILGRRPSKPIPETKTSDENGSDGNKTLVVDPISLGVAVKSLPALLKLFAALWVPVLVQIVQMASSRNNEGMADEDGALLSEDPQSLALALGLLTTWRPKAGFMLPGTALPSVIALSPMMTVNPLEQAYQAGALPKLDAFTEAVVGKGDDFLFDLFVTHPDTLVRIERLADMANALRAAKPSRPRPPTDGGGGAPPLAFAPQGSGNAPARNGGGLFRGAWEKLKGFYRVLPDEGRNRAFWAFTLGQSLATLGLYFHYTALPNLIAPTKADTAKLGENRAVGWGAQAAGSLLTGPFVDRQPVTRTLVWTNAGRALLMAMVPVLFATGYFGFAAFCLLIGVAGFLQATGGTAAQVAFNQILGADEAYYNRANAIMTIATNVAGVIGPLMAGAFIAWAGGFFAAPLMGSAMCYAVYAVVLLAVAVAYGLLMRLPRDETLQARRDLLASLKGADLGGARATGVAAGRLPDGRTALLVQIAGGDPAQVKGLPSEFAGHPVSAVAATNALRELIAGFKLAWSDRFLRLYLLLTTLSIASGDSLVFAVMPRYLADVLKASPGAFGMFLSATALGLGLASAAMTFVKDPAEAALAPVAAEFRAALAAREPDLDASALDRAAAVLRGSLNHVLDRYKAEWREGRGRVRPPEELAADVLAQAVPELAALLKLQDAQAAALLEASGAARDARAWAARRGPRYQESARRDAKSGMDSLQRQGRWSYLMHAASWLAYGGVFLVHSLWPSLALMLLSAVLGGPGGIIISSLTTRVVSGSFPNDQGKVYSAITFYMLAVSVLGVLSFGWLMAAVPTATALLVTYGVLLACVGFDVALSFRGFPLKGASK